MELAVPLIALGGLYVASNQEDKKEGYESMGKPANSLPNSEPLPVNYPKTAPVNNNNPNMKTVRISLEMYQKQTSSRA